MERSGAPFVYLFALLVGAYGAAVVVGWAAPRLRRFAGLTLPVAHVIVVVVMVAVAATASWAQRDLVTFWAWYNYSGFEAKPAWSEAEALFAELDELPSGRVMWEYNPAYDSFGTPRTLENIPVFTSQSTMEGLLMESSLNAPFHFINQAELSETATRAVPGVDYPEEMDFQLGLEHLRLYGVRYFAAFTAAVQAEADAAGLPVVGEVPTPVANEDAKERDDRDETGAPGRGFVIYEVGDGHLVEVPPFRPVTTTDPDWRDRSLEWYRDPDALRTPLVYTNDDAEARAAFAQEPADEGTPPSDLPREPLAQPGPVPDVRWDGNERLEFTTDRVGEPHVVKVSWFPNWQADGADGPWMLSPGLMVLVPTQPEVALTYRDTPLEITGKAMTGTGLLILTASAVRGWRRRRREHAPAGSVHEVEPHPSSRPTPAGSSPTRAHRCPP